MSNQVLLTLCVGDWRMSSSVPVCDIRSAIGMVFFMPYSQMQGHSPQLAACVAVAMHKCGCRHIFWNQNISHDVINYGQDIRRLNQLLVKTQEYCQTP